MAVPTLTATKNPVQILHPLHHGNTTISWKMDGLGRGAVWVSINGAPEVQFSPPQAGKLASQGTQQAGINLGESLLFTLYLGDRASKLRDLAVTAEQTFGNEGGGTLHDVLCDLGLIQCIQNLRVFPGPDFVDFAFQTSRPTVPIIAVSTDAPGPGPSFGHTDGVGGGGEGLQHFSRITRLAQETTYHYIIWAATSTIGTNTIATGTFTTGSRNLRVTFERIHVIRDGDPGGSGELFFTFAAYDASDDSLIAGAEPYPSDDDFADIGDGQDVTVSRAIEIANAPAALTFYAFCIDNDVTEGLPGEGIVLLGTGVPDVAPDGPEQGEDDIGEWATAVQTFEPGGFLPMPFQMDSANGGVAFQVFGRIEGQITTGVWTTKRYRRSAPPPMTAVAGGLGEAASVVSGGGRIAMVAPGLASAVYCKVFSRGLPQTSPSPWLDLGGKIEGPVTDVFAEEDRLDIFGLGPYGTLLYNRIGVGETSLKASGWQDLGGKLAGPVTATVAENGRLDLFALDPDGAVQHRALRGSYPEPEPDGWQDLGGKFRDPITAVAIGPKQLEVFASGQDRGVYHKSLYDGKAWPAGRDWEDLGGDFSPRLLVAVPLTGDRLELFAFVDEKTIYRKLRDEGRWLPSQTDWERLVPLAAYASEE